MAKTSSSHVESGFYFRLKSCRESLSNSLEFVEKTIASLPIKQGKQHESLPLLLSYRGFAERLGYSKMIASPPIMNLLSCGYDERFDGYTFRGFIRNALNRRACFYLNQFQCYWEPKESTKLELLSKYFGAFKKSTLEDPVTALENVNGADYELAPLYETSVDPELFTALFYLKQLVTPPSHPSKIKLAKKLAGRKIRKILQHHLTENFGLRSYKESRICDEGNLFWATCLLYSIEGRKFTIHGRPSGVEVFEDAVLTFLDRKAHERKIPAPTEIVFEVTPEIYTRERTNLYIMENLLSVMSLHGDGLSDNFKMEVRKYFDNIITMFVFPMAEDTNLYFQSLRHGCLKKYCDVFGTNDAESVCKGVPPRISFERDYSELLVDGKRYGDMSLTPLHVRIIKHCIDLKKEGGTVFDYNKMPNAPKSMKLCDVFRSRPGVYDLLFENRRYQEYIIKF